MAIDWKEFDSKVDMKEIERQKKEAAENGGFEDIPKGCYIAKIENMELGVTKKDQRPMFKLQMRLIEGCGTAEEKFLSKYKKKKPCVFMNRVMFGTKNDGSMIKSVETFLDKLGLGSPIVFESYKTFADDVMDAAEECEKLEYSIDYDKDQFDTIKIVDVFET